jgi:MoaA/NifB/PqqE/SkfB family radical SAM enzyme
MDDLRGFGVPVLILSGGEPLLRPDIFAISSRAKAMGFYVGLSTNGTLIDVAMADRIAAVGYDYVGISLDRIGATHDAFRPKQGAFVASLGGIRLCRQRGLKVGLRFTLTLDNADQLPDTFSQIWPDVSDPVMAGLKQRPRPLKGRCGRCPFLDICGGNTRDLGGRPRLLPERCRTRSSRRGAEGGPYSLP